MKRNRPAEDTHVPQAGETGEKPDPPGKVRHGTGVPRWIAVVGSCVLVFWACLRLFDHQHPAARAARGLWSLQPSERLAAIRELEGSGRVDTEVAIPALIRALENTDAEVRAAAALVSAVPGTSGATAPMVTHVHAALRALVKSLDDRQPSVLAADTRALWMVILVNQVPAGQIDLEPATNAVTQCLDDPDPAVRLSAIQGLGAIGPKVLGDPPAKLVAALDDDSEKSRDAAIEALAAFHHGLPGLIPSRLAFAMSQSRQRTPLGRDVRVGQPRIDPQSSEIAARSVAHDQDDERPGHVPASPCLLR
jgi:HEAT repeat protein